MTKKLMIILSTLFTLSLMIVINPSLAQAQMSGNCGDEKITQAIFEVTGRFPKDTANLGECNAQIYGNRWRSVEELKPLVLNYFKNTSEFSNVLPFRGNCRDPWVTQAITEIIGRSPEGEGDRGQCDYRRYGGGSWSSYEDLKQKVRASLFNSDPSKTKERCFGAMGSGCNALEALGSLGDLKVGRTNLGNGKYLMWISVGSIMHDNCCLANPNGKMCFGNDEAKKPFGNGDGSCVQEWDKAFWNGVDGRSWTIEVNDYTTPNLTIVNNPRSAKSRNGTVLTKFETSETRRYSAPRGQKLDVGDEKFCQSGSGKQYYNPVNPSQKWIVCD